MNVEILFNNLNSRFADVDVFGKALSDFYFSKAEDVLWLRNSYGEPEEMPIDVFFRTEEEMPELELTALDYCTGATLDIGAGVGSHALIMQSRGASIAALELNTQACSIMKLRGVKNVINHDIFSYISETFDTLLLLMNGIGLCGSISGLKKFLKHARLLLNPGGRIIFDSSDIQYLYDGADKPQGKYFGEIAYQYEYKGYKSDWFEWIYIDWRTMSEIAKEEGFDFCLLYEDGQDQYLGSLQIRSYEETTP